MDATQCQQCSPPHRPPRGAAQPVLLRGGVCRRAGIGSVSLFADSIDFAGRCLGQFPDFRRSGTERGAAGAGRHGPCGHSAGSRCALWTAWDKFNVPVPPEPVPLILTGAGAWAINFGCAYSWPATGRLAAVSRARPSCRRERHCHTEQVEAVFDRGEARLKHCNRLAGHSPGRQ